jgi:hypothetical protein
LYGFGNHHRGQIPTNRQLRDLGRLELHLPIVENGIRAVRQRFVEVEENRSWHDVPLLYGTDEQLNVGAERRAKLAKPAFDRPLQQRVRRQCVSSQRLRHGIRSGSLLPELLGEPDEDSFGTPDVAEPIHVFILDHFADELRAAFAEPGKRIVDVLHGEHDA